MNRKYKGLVENWREVANVLLAKNPNDGIALGLQKCAADLEAALKTNACERTVEAIFLAVGFIAFEAIPEFVKERGNDTYTLVERQSPIPTSSPTSSGHTHQEQEETRTFSVRAASASGSNVSAQAISYTMVLAPGYRIQKDKL